jgi:hypothetical protein
MEDERNSTATVGRRSAATAVPTLGSGAFRDRLRQDADLIAAGELAAPEALPLLERRLKEVGFSLGQRDVDPVAFARAIALDDQLAPLLALAAFRALGVSYLAEPLVIAFRLAVQVIEEAERAAVRAEPYVAVATRHGVDGFAARELHRLATIEHELGVSPDERVSRRRAQRRRRAWEPGMGRRRQPGAEGAEPNARRRDLLARFRELPAEEQSALVGPRCAGPWIEEHRARWTLERRTAERDWQWVRQWLSERGLLDLHTRQIQATLAGDVDTAAVEAARAEKLRSRFVRKPLRSS